MHMDSIVKGETSLHKQFLFAKTYLVSSSVTGTEQFTWLLSHSVKSSLIRRPIQKLGEKSLVSTVWYYSSPTSPPLPPSTKHASPWATHFSYKREGAGELQYKLCSTASYTALLHYSLSNDVPYFFDQATIYFVVHFVRLLFEVGVYFFGKPWDVNDSWIGYVRVRRWRLLDAVSSTRSLSLLLSAVEMTRTTQTDGPSASVVTVVRNHSHTCAAAFTTCGYYWRAAFISFKSFRLCGYYSRAASIRRNTVY